MGEVTTVHGEGGSEWSLETVMGVYFRCQMASVRFRGMGLTGDSWTSLHVDYAGAQGQLVVAMRDRRLVAPFSLHGS